MSNAVVIGLVEDDDEVRGAYAELLRSYDFTSYSYKSAESFVADRGETKVSCLVLDQHLPGMTGLALQNLLRQRGSEIPIVFVTADTKPALQQQAIAGGAKAFIHKPVNADYLIMAVLAAMSR